MIETKAGPQAVFLEKCATALKDTTFVRLTFGAYAGPEIGLEKLQVRLVELKSGTHLQFRQQFRTRDVVKNVALASAVESIAECMKSGFRSARLFTTENDWQLDPAKDGTVRIHRAPPTFKDKPTVAHDREKSRLIDARSPWLQALGVMDAQGHVREKMSAKWTQINAFIDILDAHLNASPLAQATAIRLSDMGCGKGYLTFAAYAYLRETRGVQTTVIGVEQRDDLVTTCNTLAKKCGYEGLSFIKGYINEIPLAGIDVLVALHACNTATDDALHAGIQAGTSIILCAPCCHQEIRPQLIAPEVLSGVLKHGILAERMAELVTDGLRAMLLEQAGYTAKVLEFVPDEHTPKNLLITGIRHERRSETIHTATNRVGDEIKQLKAFFGVESQRLEKLMAGGPLPSTEAAQSLPVVGTPR
ncbi:MAG: SAM-dependent methyltransferase [Verrucomicrobiota bacterium]|nr:SAM-dependent methyltransferase [Verrucomicrobiota bacterium]